MEKAYDSRQETIEHILRVRELLYIVQNKLEARGFAHDQSKLGPNEKPLFDAVTGKLRGLTYGSDEYKASLKDLGPALQHHYANNSHHPEHFKLFRCGVCNSILKDSETWFANSVRLCSKCCPVNPIYECEALPHLGVDGMTLLDVIEMLVDWKAAGERHANGDIRRSLEVNKTRFNISPQLQSILENTVKEMGW